MPGDPECREGVKGGERGGKVAPPGLCSRSERDLDLSTRKKRGRQILILALGSGYRCCRPRHCGSRRRSAFVRATDLSLRAVLIQPAFAANLRAAVVPEDAALTVVIHEAVARDHGCRRGRDRRGRVVRLTYTRTAVAHTARTLVVEFALHAVVTRAVPWRVIAVGLAVRVAEACVVEVA